MRVILGCTERHWWRPWAFLKWGGHSGLESTSNTKVVLSRWQHHVLKTRLRMSVSALLLLCWHIFRLLWLHSKPHTVVRPEYLGATLILCLSLTPFTFKKREWARRVCCIWFRITPGEKPLRISIGVWCAKAFDKYDWTVDYSVKKYCR